MKNKRVKRIIDKEKEIMDLLDSNDDKTLFGFNAIRFYYYIDDLMNRRNHSKLIESVYIDRVDDVKWVQANNCNISHRTAFRYRNAYVELLNILNGDQILKELAVTLDGLV